MFMPELIHLNKYVEVITVAAVSWRNEKGLRRVKADDSRLKSRKHELIFSQYSPGHLFHVTSCIRLLQTLSNVKECGSHWARSFRLFLGENLHSMITRALIKKWENRTMSQALLLKLAPLCWFTTRHARVGSTTTWAVPLRLKIISVASLLMPTPF